VAIESALQIVRERKADASKQLEVVRIFGEIHLPESIPVLLEMLEQPRSDQLKVAALGALQQYSDKNIGIRIAGMLDSLSGDVAHAAQTLLVSRADWCQQLFAALEAGKLDAKTVPGDIVRLMTVHPNNDKLVRKYWPDLAGESTTAEMQQRIERYAGTLASGTGNPYAGLKLYSQSCGKCHMLFGQGGRIGPDLTAYNRDDTVRMLLHVVNPSVEIREGFTTYLVTTDDGRAASGFLYEETPAVLVLRTATGQTITIPQTEVDEKLPLAKSIMPEGLLDEMTDQQIRDLFAYLRAGQPISK
jgi:putative heme-binding domain-containing protein